MGAVEFKSRRPRIVADGTLPGNNRKIKAVYLLFIFDDAVDLTTVPSYVAELRQVGVADVAGDPVAIDVESPSAAAATSFEVPNEYQDIDPARSWRFKMVRGENLNVDGTQKSLVGLKTSRS